MQKRKIKQNSETEKVPSFAELKPTTFPFIFDIETILEIEEEKISELNAAEIENDKSVSPGSEVEKESM